MKINQFCPIRLKRNLPDYFAYVGKEFGNIYSYNLTNKKGQYLGKMRAYINPETSAKVYRPQRNDYASFCIDYLYVKPKFRGERAGTALLDMAKHDSYKFGCNGNVHVIAGYLKNESTVPQVFYRKNGFITQNKKDMKIIDKAISKKYQFPMRFYLGTPMYFKP